MELLTELEDELKEAIAAAEAEQTESDEPIDELPCECCLLTNINANILEIIQNTLIADADISPEQADTMLKLAHLRNLLRDE